MPWRLLLQTLGIKGRKNPDPKIFIGTKNGKECQVLPGISFFVKTGDHYLLSSPYLEKS